MANNRKQATAILALIYNKQDETGVDAVLDGLVVGAPVKITDGRIEETFATAYANTDLDPRTPEARAAGTPMTAAQKATVTRKALRTFVQSTFEAVRANAAADAARAAALVADADPEA